MLLVDMQKFIADLARCLEDSIPLLPQEITSHDDAGEHRRTWRPKEEATRLLNHVGWFQHWVETTPMEQEDSHEGC